MRFRQLIAALLLLGLPAVATAGNLLFSVAGGTSPAALAALTDFQLDSGRASLGVWWATGPGLALHVRNTTTFGPLGNVIVDFDASAGVRDGFSVTLAARGAVGPVAVRLRGHSASSDDLPQLRDQGGDFPGLPAAGTGTVRVIQAGTSWRISRELTVSFDPSFTWVRGTTQLLLPLQLQLARYAAGHDLLLGVSTMVPLAGTGLEAWSAAGAGLRINRGRAAAWEVWLLLGGNRHLSAPGLKLAVQDEVAGGTFRAGLQLEPWQQTRAMLSLSADWLKPVGNRDLRLFLDVAAPAARLAAGVSVSFPLD